MLFLLRAQLARGLPLQSILAQTCGVSSAIMEGSILYQMPYETPVFSAAGHAHAFPR